MTDFASFPRARLTLQWNRRQLLTSLTTELRVRSERNTGGADMKIAELGTLPDEILELMTPHLTSAYQGDEHGPAFALTVDLIDGRLTLRQIADRVAAACQWDRGYAFSYARGVFLHLASHGCSRPGR